VIFTQPSSSRGMAAKTPTSIETFLALDSTKSDQKLFNNVWPNAVQGQQC
jgi:hypothetical protein